MVIQLPRDNEGRQAALAYLAARGIRHMRLFQAVEVADRQAGLVFKAWLADRPKPLAPRLSA